MSLRDAYKKIREEQFPENMEIHFYDDPADKQVLTYKKVTWNIGGEEKGLRYGENPDQSAALYRLEDGALALGDVRYIQPGESLVSDVALLQSGKHPGKINLTDVESALQILKYMNKKPTVVIIKHNNPSGVACRETLADAYQEAFMADCVAAFGGAAVLNRELDKETAERIISHYTEVVAAPGFADGVLDILSKKKNLRVMEIARMDRLQEYASKQYLDFKGLMDGGIVLQNSFASKILSASDFMKAEITYKGQAYSIHRQPTEAEYNDLLFGWFVEAGVTSNSVIYVKNGATVGIGTGEQDRVGVARIARDKAYEKYKERLAFEQYECPFGQITDVEHQKEIEYKVSKERGGLKGAAMISDAFFPFRDGIDVGLKEGVTAVAQPGGSLRDYESIEACNEHNAAMVFTGQRSFRH